MPSSSRPSWVLSCRCPSVTTMLNGRPRPSQAKCSLVVRGRDGIRDDWQTKVVGGQANITCELLNLYLDDGTAIAEWQAEFDDTAQQVRKRMREVALLTFDGPLIAGLREYWASEVVELSPAALAHRSAARTADEPLE